MLTVVDTAFSATCAVVSTVHCIAAFPESIIDSHDVIFWKVLTTHSFKSLATHTAHCTTACHVSIVVDTAHCTTSCHVLTA